MAGNAWQWCADFYEERAYERYADGSLEPPTSGALRVTRGGSYYDPYWDLGARAACRGRARWRART